MFFFRDTVSILTILNESCSYTAKFAKIVQSASFLRVCGALARQTGRVDFGYVVESWPMCIASDLVRCEISILIAFLEIVDPIDFVARQSVETA